MSEDTQLTKLETKISKLFEKKTPKTAIKTRPGVEGLNFPYVDFGYVLKELDSNFGIFWEFKIIDKSVTDKYVWVTGELTIKSPDGFSISRPGTGGSKVKYPSKFHYEKGKKINDGPDYDKGPLNLANDIKGATTMAIRKAASLYGIGADVAYKEIGMYEQSPDTQDEGENGDKFIRQKLISKFFAMAAERGFDGEAAKKLIKNGFSVAHMEDLSFQQIGLGIRGLEQKYDLVPQGEPPHKFNEIAEVPEVPIKKDCRQCGKDLPEGNDPEWFCDKKCQNEYWENAGAKVV